MERVDWLLDALDSLRIQTKPPIEIILVFDKNDGLEDTLNRKVTSAVLKIPNKAGYGLSMARNTGVDIATGDIVAFLDDDAVAEPDWLEQLVRPYIDSVVVGVGGKAVPDWLKGERPFWFPEELDWVTGCTHAGFQDGRRVVRNVFGCNMSFRKTRLVEIGGFDSRLGGPISGDDTDICLRITQGNGGWQIIYEPEAVIHHKIPRQRRSLKYIANSSWKQGVGKAVTRIIHKKDNRALASEKSYLKHLIFKFIPRQMHEVFRHPLNTSGHIISVITVIISMGTGYVVTIFNVRRKRN